MILAEARPHIRRAEAALRELKSALNRDDFVDAYAADLLDEVDAASADLRDSLVHEHSGAAV